MTKQEKIQEVYGEYWPYVKNHVDKNGWFDCGKKGERSLLSYFQVFNLDFEIHYQRPKLLQGLTSNNGWIKFEDKEKQKVFDSIDVVFTDKGNTYSYATYCNFASIYELENITHFQQLVKPKPPIY